MKQITRRSSGGFAGWLLARMAGEGKSQSRLVVIERVALAPRQSLFLIEAEGRSLLVATSPEGAPAFHVLDGDPSVSNSQQLVPLLGRIS
jgi:flagellar biogenesis protein FliO